MQKKTEPTRTWDDPPCWTPYYRTLIEENTRDQQIFQLAPWGGGEGGTLLRPAVPRECRRLQVSECVCVLCECVMCVCVCVWQFSVWLPPSRPHTLPPPHSSHHPSTPYKLQRESLCIASPPPPPIMGTNRGVVATGGGGYGREGGVANRDLQYIYLYCMAMCAMWRLARCMHKILRKKNSHSFWFECVMCLQKKRLLAGATFGVSWREKQKQAAFN